MAEEGICAFVVGSGSGQEEPGMTMRVELAIGNGPLRNKRLVIAYIKARSKHSFETETAWHKKKEDNYA